VINLKKKKVKTPAANERFHASGGVARPEGSANLHVLSPAQTVVSRRLREAATPLPAMAGDSSLYKRFSGLKTDTQETLGEADSREKVEA
jgi:hypothetical protein